MTEPTLEEMIADYERHMTWYVPTINKLQREWYEIQSSASKVKGGDTNEN